MFLITAQHISKISSILGTFRHYNLVRYRCGEKNVHLHFYMTTYIVHFFSVLELYCTKFRPKRGVPIGRKIYFITFSAYVLFTILLYGAFCVSSPASVIINCSLSKLSSFSTGVSFHASMSL